MSIMPDVTSLPVIGTACTATLDIDSGLGNLFWTPLVASTPNNYFAATWSSNFQVSTGGEYYFLIGYGNDDAFILSIDGTVLINAEVVEDVETYGYSDDHAGSDFNLSPGLHSVVLDYFHNEDTAGLSIQYFGPDTNNNYADLQGEAPHPACERERTLFFVFLNGSPGAGSALRPPERVTGVPRALWRSSRANKPRAYCGPADCNHAGARCDLPIAPAAGANKTPEHRGPPDSEQTAGRPDERAIGRDLAPCPSPRTEPGHAGEASRP